MRAFIFVDNEKAVAQMIDDLFQHTRKSMKVIDDDVFCSSEKKPPPPIPTFPHPFHFGLIWYLGVYHDGNFFGIHHKVEERGKCPCFSSKPLTPKRNNALNHLLLSGEL